MSTRHRFTYDFSIWYCPEDHAVASIIAEFLMKKGFRGYLEHWDQVAGTPVVLSATEAIGASRVGILLLSPTSVGDAWCQRVSEWNLQHVVERGGTRLLPVCLGVRKEEVPPFLQHLTQLQYQTPFFFERLLRSLAASQALPGEPRRAES